MDIISILFYLVTSVVILSSIALIAVNNTVHAALLLVLIFFNTAILWLMMNAEFLAIVLVFSIRRSRSGFIFICYYVAGHPSTEDCQ